VRLKLGAVKEVLDVNSESLKRSHAANRLSLAVFSLSAVAAVGAPLGAEIAGVAAAAAAAAGGGITGSGTEASGGGSGNGGGDSLVAAVLASVPTSSIGVPTASSLADRLVDVNRSARALVLMPGGGGGLLAAAIASAASWLRVSERTRWWSKARAYNRWRFR